MDKEEVDQLHQMFEKLDITQENIMKTSSFMLSQSKKGYAKQCVEIWKKHEELAKDNAKLCFYFVLHDCIRRFNEDDMNLLKAFPEVLNEMLFNSISACDSHHTRMEIATLIGVWKRDQLYSPSYIEFLEAEINRANKQNPVKPKPSEYGVNIKVKFFSVYFRNYQESKVKIEKLEKELKELRAMPGTSSQTLESTIDEYEKTLIALRVNRRNLLKSSIELIREYRQHLGLRLHKIEEIEKIKERIAKFVDFPDQSSDEVEMIS